MARVRGGESGGEEVRSRERRERVRGSVEERGRLKGRLER